MLSYLFFADVTILCGAIREGDYDYCKEWVLSLVVFKNFEPDSFAPHNQDP